MARSYLRQSPSMASNVLLSVVVLSLGLVSASSAPAPTGQPTASEAPAPAPGVKTCNVMGPSYYTAGGQRIPGQDWPISLGATAAPQDCADRCAALLACNGYHFYGSQESRGAGTCYLWQGVTGVRGPMHDGRDRYAGSCSCGAGECTSTQAPHPSLANWGSNTLFTRPQLHCYHILHRLPRHQCNLSR